MSGRKKYESSTESSESSVDHKKTKSIAKKSDKDKKIKTPIKSSTESSIDYKETKSKPRKKVAKFSSESSVDYKEIRSKPGKKTAKDSSTDESGYTSDSSRKTITKRPVGKEESFSSSSESNQSIEFSNSFSGSSSSEEETPKYKDHREWIVEHSFANLSTLLYESRQFLLSTFPGKRLDYVCFWHINPLKNIHGARIVFSKLTNNIKEMLGLRNIWSIRPVEGTDTELTKYCLVNIKSSKDKSTIKSKLNKYISANLKSLEPDAKLDNLYYSVMYNTWICTFDREVDTCNIMKNLPKESWLKQSMCWPIISVPESMYREPPFSTEWKANDKLLGRTDIDLNSVMKDNPKKIITPKIRYIVPPYYTSKTWIVEFEKDTNVDKLTSDNLISSVVKKSKSRYLVVFKQKKTEEYVRRHLISIDRKLESKIIHISFSKEMPNPFISDRELEDLNKLVGIQFTNIKECHDCFMDLVRPWSRPRQLSPFTRIVLDNNSNAHSIFVTNCNIKPSKLKEFASQYGTVIGIYTFKKKDMRESSSEDENLKEREADIEAFIKSEDRCKPNNVPAKLETSPKKLWAVQYQCVQDAYDAFNSNKTEMKMDKTNPHVIYYKSNRTNDNILSFYEMKHSLMSHGPIVQLKYIYENAIDRTVRKPMKNFSKEMQHKIFQIPESMMFVSDMNMVNIRMVSKTLNEFVQKHMCSNTFWKSKVERKFNKKLGEYKELNWNTMYNIFSESSPGSVFSKSRFPRVIDLCIEIGFKYEKYLLDDMSGYAFKKLLANVHLDNKKLKRAFSSLHLYDEEDVDKLETILVYYKPDDEDWKRLTNDRGFSLIGAEMAADRNLLPVHVALNIIGKTSNLDDDDLMEEFAGSGKNRYIEKMYQSLVRNPSLTESVRNKIISQCMVTSTPFAERMLRERGMSLITQLDLDDIINKIESQSSSHDFVLEWISLARGASFQKNLDKIIKEYGSDHVLNETFQYRLTLLKYSNPTNEEIFKTRLEAFYGNLHYFQVYLSTLEWFYLDFTTD